MFALPCVKTRSGDAGVEVLGSLLAARPAVQGPRDVVHHLPPLFGKDVIPIPRQAERHYRQLPGGQFPIGERAQLTIAPKMETEVGRREEAYQPPALRVRRRVSHVKQHPGAGDVRQRCAPASACPVDDHRTTQRIGWSATSRIRGFYLVSCLAV